VPVRCARLGSRSGPSWTKPTAHRHALRPGSVVPAEAFRRADVAGQGRPMNNRAAPERTRVSEFAGSPALPNVAGRCPVREVPSMTGRTLIGVDEQAARSRWRRLRGASTRYVFGGRSMWRQVLVGLADPMWSRDSTILQSPNSYHEDAWNDDPVAGRVDPTVVLELGDDDLRVVVSWTMTCAGSTRIPDMRRAASAKWATRSARDVRWAPPSRANGCVTSSGRHTGPQDRRGARRRLRV